MATERIVDTKWFKRKIEEKGYSQRKLAEMMGMEPSALNLTLHGKRGMLVEEAGMLALMLNVEIDEIMRRAGAYRRR